MASKLDELIRCIDDQDVDETRAYELVGELVESGDRSLSPELVNKLRDFVMKRHPYGRDVIAAAYAELEGMEALPILLRASSVDMGEEDDQENLRSIIMDVITLDPAHAAKVVDDLERDPNPRNRAVAVWARELVSFVSED